MRAYQATCAEVIQRFDGHIAQYLGDGLLVYFGYPQAHEDDAQRAVRTGLGHGGGHGHAQYAAWDSEQGVRLAVRVGIHTGLVVVGEMGGGGRQEQLALGDTPNIAARLQGLAAPDTVVISAATQRLIQGYFTCQDLGAQTLKGVATPLQVYQVVRASGVQSASTSRRPAASRRWWGASTKWGCCWTAGRRSRRAGANCGAEWGGGDWQIAPGPGGEGRDDGAAALRIEYRCSPYHQHSALYPVIAHLERVLAWRQDETPADRLRKLEEAFRPYPLPLAEVVPLFAALLSLPLPEDRYPPLTLTPQRQKQKTLEALLTWLLALTEQQPVLFVVEDLHWIDPSTLEFLTLLVEQGPTARLLTLLTCRPEFQLPWGLRTHLTPIALQRLPQPQVEAMIARVTGGKALPPEVVAQIVAKTDGVPLFVEELTKTVLVAPQLTVVRWPCDTNGGPAILLQVRSPTLLGGQAWTPQRHSAPIWRVPPEAKPARGILASIRARTDASSARSVARPLPQHTGQSFTACALRATLWR